MNDARYDEYLALIGSDRVSAKTREALLERAEADDPAYVPQVLDAAGLAILRCVLGRVLPQDRIDIAQRLDKALSSGEGDGWRFAALAKDGVADCEALAAMKGFDGLDAAGQDAALVAIAAGERGEMLKLWFEDLRGRATMIYVSHPSTFARMGYSGIAYGGDGPDRPGFHALAAGEREPWEPLAQGDSA